MVRYSTVSIKDGVYQRLSKLVVGALSLRITLGIDPAVKYGFWDA